MRVLVVDDNKDNRDVLALALRGFGCAVTTAGDGASALACADEFRPEVVFLDILMPGINGFQLAQKLRQHPALTDVTLISMSGFALDMSDPLWQRSGCDHHLLKPWDPTLLERVVQGERPTCSHTKTK